MERRRLVGHPGCTASRCICSCRLRIHVLTVEASSLSLKIFALYGMADGRGAMPKGKATSLALMPEERAELEKLVRRRKTAQDLALRARIVLRCAEGATNQAVAGEV